MGDSPLVARATQLLAALKAGDSDSERERARARHERLFDGSAGTFRLEEFNETGHLMATDKQFPIENVVALGSCARTPALPEEGSASESQHDQELISAEVFVDSDGSSHRTALLKASAAIVPGNVASVAALTMLMHKHKIQGASASGALDLHNLRILVVGGPPMCWSKGQLDNIMLNTAPLKLRQEAVY